MMGNTSIDLSLSNIHNSWYAFRKGKRRTLEIEEYQYFLENRLFSLFEILNAGSYKHGEYRHFWVSDSKRRQIAVASINDRVVHRLLYEYLVKIFDQSFNYDAWSCRKDKGLVGAIQRTEKFAHKYKDGYFWKADIKKFFDYVDHSVLREFLFRKVSCEKAKGLLNEIISSFGTRERERERERDGLRPRDTDRQSNQSDFCQYLFK